MTEWGLFVYCQLNNFSDISWREQDTFQWDDDDDDGNGGKPSLSHSILLCQFQNGIVYIRNILQNEYFLCF
jgi:hypothetical protein